jgi:hypothetical protein
MELCRHREVEAVVLVVGDPSQELERFVLAALLLPECLRAADSEVAYRARTRTATKLGQRGPELGVDGDLDTRACSSHTISVPPNWYTTPGADTRFPALRR